MICIKRTYNNDLLLGMVISTSILISYVVLVGPLHIQVIKNHGFVSVLHRLQIIEYKVVVQNVKMTRCLPCSSILDH